MDKEKDKGLNIRPPTAKDEENLCKIIRAEGELEIPDKTGKKVTAFWARAIALETKN